MRRKRRKETRQDLIRTSFHTARVFIRHKVLERYSRIENNSSTLQVSSSSSSSNTFPTQFDKQDEKTVMWRTYPDDNDHLHSQDYQTDDTSFSLSSAYYDETLSLLWPTNDVYNNNDTNDNNSSKRGSISYNKTITKTQSTNHSYQSFPLHTLNIPHPPKDENTPLLHRNNDTNEDIDNDSLDDDPFPLLQAVASTSSTSPTSYSSSTISRDLQTFSFLQILTDPYMIYTFIRLWVTRIIHDVLLFRKGQEDLSCLIHLLTLGMLSFSVVTLCIVATMTTTTTIKSLCCVLASSLNICFAVYIRIQYRKQSIRQGKVVRECRRIYRYIVHTCLDIC